MQKALSFRNALMLAIASMLVACLAVVVGCSCSQDTTKKDATDTYTVPNVVSLTQADAEKAILASGLMLGDVKQEASDTVPLGSVISQDPAALTTAKANSKVNIVVSSGKEAPKDVQVPDLKGKSQADAEKALKDVNLVPVSTKPEESTDVAPGQVFKQSVAAGTTVKEGTQVSFTVALAPSDATVPDVTGMTHDDAKDALAKANLGFDFTTAYNDTVDKDKVISQSIAAGTKVKAGTTVTVTVSLGPKPASDVQVPDVTSCSWSDAEATLHSAGLAARYTGDPAGVVVSQDVAPGTMVAPNTLVTVTLQSPVETITVPDLTGMTITAAEEATDALGLALDSSGDPTGTVTDQSPAAGTQVAPRTTVHVTVTADKPTSTWTDAKSADDAAKGAGLSSFSVPSSVTVNGTTYSNPKFAYANGIAQARYEGGAAAVVLRKGAGAGGTYAPGDVRDYTSEWTQTYKSLQIDCHGYSDGNATLAEWSSGNDAFMAYYQGLGGESVSMSADDVNALVDAIK